MLSKSNTNLYIEYLYIIKFALETAILDRSHMEQSVAAAKAELAQHTSAGAQSSQCYAHALIALYHIQACEYEATDV